MKSKNRNNLHVVKEERDQTDEIIDKIMEELRDEDGSMEELEDKIARHKRRFWFKSGMITLLVLAVVIGTYILLTSQTYSEARVLNKYGDTTLENGNYVEFADGVLKYSRDGIVFLDQKGRERWNQSCQMKHPSAVVVGKTAAVVDIGGNDILVFEASGLKGEIHTTLPIQKISISEQGIVAAILKDNVSPQVVCYDAAGNILVEHKASTAGTGYPVDVSLSPNGEILLVSYLYTYENSVDTKISYYNFGTVGQDKTDHQVTEAKYEDQIMPMTFFAGSDTSIIVGDKQMVIYKGGQIPELHETVEIGKEIKSVFYEEKNIGFILKNEGAKGYELRLYDTAGRQVTSVNFKGEYGNVKISGGQIIMYEGNRLAIFMKSGHKRFEGEMETNIMDMIPMFGFNKYLMMSTGGLEEVRLVK